MTPIAFCLLGIAVLAVPLPAPAARRLAWLGTARLGRPTEVSRTAVLPGARSVARAVAGRPWLCAALLAVACGALAGLVPGVLAAAAAFALARCARLLAGDRDSDRARAELLAAVAALSGEYAAGATVSGAFSAAAPVSGRHASAMAAAAVLAAQGVEVSAALAAEPMLAPLAVACATATQGGSSLTDVLAGVHADVAADRATRRAVQAALTGPRTSAVLLAVLPAIGLGMGAAMGAHPARVLLHTPIGLAALTAGVMLDVAGLVWTLALTRGALP